METANTTKSTESTQNISWQQDARVWLRRDVVAALERIRDAQNVCIVSFLRVSAKCLRCKCNADITVSLCLGLIECSPCVLTVAMNPKQRPCHGPGVIDLSAGCWNTEILLDAHRDSAGSSLLTFL